MRKCLLFVALCLVSQLNYIKAQSLFGAPDTVCIRQPVHLTDSVNAQSYYWGFCSGYLFNTAVGTNLGTNPDFDTPSGIEIAKDGANYFGFVANAGNGTLVRLNYGPSLALTPTNTNFGTMNNAMPVNPNKLFLYKDTTGNWYLFVTGGTNTANSTLARLDFGKSLANTPNIVNFGNLAGGLFNSPRGLFIQKGDTNYYGYVVNNVDNKLIRLDFGKNISQTPIAIDLGAGYGFANPTDLVAVNESNNWYFFVTNQTTNSITLLDFGTSLSSAPSAQDIGTIGNKLFGPTGITFIRDCGTEHLLVLNGVSNDITRVDMPTVLGPYSGTQFTGIGSLSLPASISHVIRERDNLFSFVTNSFGNSISQIVFPQCHNTNIASSTLSVPPDFQYDSPGTYNLYLAINEGLPNMQVECKQITVLPIPQLTLSNDTTICQGDTIELFFQSYYALSYTWKPDRNIIYPSPTTVKVFPDYTTDYRLIMPYANGCIVDTDVYVTVSKNKADAGPDRILADGAKTVLGGPNTTYSDSAGLYTYNWIPNQYISATNIPNPVASPPNDFTYYLEVRNSYGCYDIDTVVVRVECNDINLPNAFAPESKSAATKYFGLLNKQIVKLNFFKIYDRWGKEVFSTTDITKGWDGNVNGEPAPLGVYIWEADGFCTEGKRFKRSGNVTLIR